MHGMVEVNKSFTLSEIPVFVKAGSIIPMKPDNFGQHFIHLVFCYI